MNWVMKNMFQKEKNFEKKFLYPKSSYQNWYIKHGTHPGTNFPMVIAFYRNCFEPRATTQFVALDHLYHFYITTIGRSCFNKKLYPILWPYTNFLDTFCIKDWLLLS